LPLEEFELEDAGAAEELVDEEAPVTAGDPPVAVDDALVELGDEPVVVAWAAAPGANWSKQADDVAWAQQESTRDCSRLVQNWQTPSAYCYPSWTESDVGNAERGARP
jgi:hypothetical protein